VRKIQTDNVDSCAHKIAKNRLGVRSGTERGNDLGTALDRIGVLVRICERHGMTPKDKVRGTGEYECG
jgi:hypothetical protein